MTTKRREHAEKDVLTPEKDAAHAIESPVEQFIDDELIHTHHHAAHLLPWTARAAPEVGPLPLILGVTGHRDLRDEDIPRLTELVLAEYSELRTLYPSTPITLLSALADGADRLLAHL